MTHVKELTTPTRRAMLGAGATAALLGTAGRVRAQGAPRNGRPIKVGILTDMSGNYSINAGQGSVTAVNMAVEDVGSTGMGPVQVLTADHQNKPDIAVTVARQWFDVEGVDCIIDLPNSAVALAVMGIARDRKKMVLVSGAASSEISNGSCMPTAFQWTFDTLQWANTMASALVARGGTSWYFITPDYTFGLATERDITAKVTALGGTVAGSSRYPLGSPDFAQYLLQAQSSKAKVLALGTAGADMINVIKQASEFGLLRSDLLITGLLQPTEILGIGLPTASGMLLPTPFDPNRDAMSAAWTERFIALRRSPPAMTHAGTYSAARHYLQAIKDSGTIDAEAVAARMVATPVRDAFAANGTIRADGLMAHDWYLQQVKTPAQSKGPYDLATTIATVAAVDADPPLADSKCPMVKR